MTAASSVAANAAATPRLGAAMASRPLLLGLLAIGVVTAARVTGTVDSDVAWQLWIAQRIHAGANLYSDIIETNPPLWFWMALPVERLASLVHARIDSVLIVAIGALIALSLAATDRLIRHLNAARRATLLGYAALAFMAMPWMHVGQREQIVLIGALPYAALVAARREHKSIGPVLAVLIGTGAALGFALKHYFLIVPILLEVWLLAGTRNRWRPVRPETAAIMVVGLAYVAAILLLERDFLTNIVPLIRLAYGDFGAPSPRYLFGPFALAGFLTLGMIAAHARLLSGGGTPFASALLVAATGFAAAYFMQAKGGPYHAIPMLGCASLALAALLAESTAAARTLRIVAPALLVLPLAFAFEEQREHTLPSPDLLRATDGLRPGDSVGFLAIETAVPWSVTLQGRYRYASRYNGFWMMHAIMRNERLGNPEPRLDALGHKIVSDTITDFTCTPPRRIIVGPAVPGGIDILPFFLRDQRFAALLSHYRLRSRTSLETYELASPFPPRADSCRAGI